MKTINDFNFKNLKVLLRVDFNVPLNENFKIVDNTRIKSVLPTIKKLLNDGASIILMSHLGRPKNGYEKKYSLKHLVPELENLLNRKILFSSDCIGEEAMNKSLLLKSGDILLLENLRFHAEEKKGDIKFAKKLSLLGDFYVNDAFGTAHRAHSSTSVIAQFFPGKKAFGYLMAKEIYNLNKVINTPEKPFVSIIGGAKISTKINLIKNLLNISDNILIGGAMTYTFIKAKGGKTGKSLVEDNMIEEAKKILKSDINKKIILASDSLCTKEIKQGAKTIIAKSDNIPDEYLAVDISKKSISIFSEKILNAKTILWNGPMGMFEISDFSTGTKKIAELIALSTEKGAFSLVGGGDSLAALNQISLKNKISYISTGGGAMLEYIEGKKLPGIAAIEN